jgi:outer membrane protein assembly factor BamB
MQDDHESFLPETVDEQIEHTSSLPPEDAHLIDMLRRVYRPSANENAQSLDHVWQHMQHHLSQAHPLQTEHRSPDKSASFQEEMNAQVRTTRARPSRPARWNGLTHKLNVAAAILFAALVVGSMVFTFHLVSSHGKRVTPLQPIPSAPGIYLSGADQQGNYLISRLDMNSHRTIWSKNIGILNFASIVVRGNMVYVSATIVQNVQDNDVYALDATNGTLRWQAIVSQGSDNELAAPAVSGETVYVLSKDGTVSALNATNGKLLWHYKINVLYPGDVIAANGIVYAVAGTSLFTINATSGKLVWSQQIDQAQSLTSPSVVGNAVYLAASATGTGIIYSYDAKSGTLNWKHTINDSVFSTPTAANGIVYVGSGDTNLYALKASDGSELWHYTTGGQISDSPFVSNGVVYVSETGNTAGATGQPSTVSPALVAIDATRGTKLWSQQIDITLRAIQNGVIYGVGYPRTVYALKVSDGSTIWHQQYSLNLIDKTGTHSVAVPEITIIP